MKDYLATRLVSATVFLQGAELTRTATVEVAAGKNTFLVGNLPDSVNLASVTATVSEGATLLSVDSRFNYLQEPEYDDRVADLAGQLEENQTLQNRLHSRRAVVQEEEEFLRTNRAVGGEDGIKAAELRELAAFYRSRLDQLAQERFDMDKEQEELENQANRIQTQLGIYNAGARTATGEVTVELAAQAPGTVELTVNYFVNAAMWTPFYEIRVGDLDAPAVLIGRGKIQQSTGEDWQEINIVLSSGAPTSGGQQPMLSPWYLDMQTVARPRRDIFNAAPAAMAMKISEMTMDEEILEADAAGSMSKLRAAPVARQAQTTVEFLLPGPVTVPAIQEGATVEIMSHNLAAKYEHYSVRKLDRDVFLLAKISGWEKLSLLEGEVSIFLGNTFVGNTYLDPRTADDEMDISLGRDKGVIVTRVKGRDFTGRTTFGRSDKATREWDITVRNTRPSPIDIRVLDQLPVSVNKAITVEAVEISGAEYEEETGQLTWQLNLEPGESKQMRVKYAVTYPKGSNVVLE